VFRNLGSKRKLWTIGLAAAIAIAGSGMAYAYWSSQGAGSGAATTATDATSQFTVVIGTAVGTLEPGGTPVTLPVTVTNPGTTDLRANMAVAMKDASNVAFAPPAGCSIDDYSATIAMTGTNNQTIAAGANAVGTITLTLANNASADQNACKGIPVPLSVTIS
jgi:hypothetical protein